MALDGTLPGLRFIALAPSRSAVTTGELSIDGYRGSVDARLRDDDGATQIDLTWTGVDAGEEPSSGRISATVRGDSLEGRFFVHGGPDTSFVAARGPRPVPAVVAPALTAQIDVTKPNVAKVEVAKVEVAKVEVARADIFSPASATADASTRPRITEELLRGRRGVTEDAITGLVETQPATVAEALELYGVGRRITGMLLALGLITDPEGAQSA